MKKQTHFFGDVILRYVLFPLFIAMLFCGCSTPSKDADINEPATLSRNVDVYGRPMPSGYVDIDINKINQRATPVKNVDVNQHGTPSGHVVINGQVLPSWEVDIKKVAGNGSSSEDEEEEEVEVDVTELSGEIITYSAYLYNEKGLHLDDSCVYYNARNIKRVRLDYSSMGILDLCEARQLLVDVVEGFTRQVNSNGWVNAQLAHFPFDEDDLEIYIKFVSFYNRYIDLQRVGLIKLKDGIAEYFAADSLDWEVDCWHQRREWYWQSRLFADFYREGEYLYGEKIDMYGRPIKEDKDEEFSLDVGERYREQKSLGFQGDRYSQQRILGPQRYSDSRSFGPQGGSYVPPQGSYSDPRSFGPR